VSHEPLPSHRSAVLALAVGQLDGKSVVVSSDDRRTIRWWDLATATLIEEKQWVRPITTILLLNESMVWTDTARTLRVLDASGRLEQTIEIPGTVHSTAAIDSTMVAVAGEQGLLLLRTSH
jgi:WD40 repeat protein